MRSTKLCLTLVTAVLLFAGLAGAANAAGLAVELSAAKNWLGPHDDADVRVKITNNGARPVAIPRWNVPRATLDANLFEVTRDGQPVRYLGILAKRGAPGPGDFVTLKPGQSLRGRTELSKHYDLADGGEYVVSFRLDLLDGTLADELRDGAEIVDSNALTFWRDAPIRGAAIDWDRFAQAPEQLALSTTNCSSSQQSGVSSAFSSATTYAAGSLSYMNSKTYTTVGPRYTTWFGTSTSANFTTVKNHFVAIDDAFRTKPVVVDCGCTQNYYAYVYPTQPYKIYVCNAFWSAPNTGTDSRAGTLIHEMSHFNVVAATDDWAYGQTACKKLAKRASKAIDNADSHEYFSENTPVLN